MLQSDSGIPDLVFDKRLSQKEREVFEIVLQNWPVSALEIAGHFKELPLNRQHSKRLSTKYSYYLKKLVEKKLVLSKRMGNALVVWPLRAEKYRTIEHILKEVP